MMMPLRLSELAGEIEGNLLKDASFDRVSTDTRTLQKGDLYVALSGENFDGNAYVKNAEDAGACAAVVKQGVSVEVPSLQVEDTRLALGIIARANRRKFSGPVIALTGSAGKTSTKEMIANILSVAGEVLATEGNLNNEIGVPMTLLNIGDQHRYAVIEMGASRSGDIAYLTQFAEPTISVLTNAMPAHIESFGDIETIAKTKGEIFENLALNETAIINYDDAFYKRWVQQAGSANIVTFSKSDSDADCFSSDHQMMADGSTQFTINTQQGSVSVSLALLGEHNIVNALAATAAAITAGANLDQVKQGLEQCKAVSGRLSVIQCDDQVVIDDTYNANPGAVKAAIDVLSEYSESRCLVLGTMAELGADAIISHQEIACYAKDSGIEQLIAVGEYAQAMKGVFGEGGVAFTELESLFDDYKTFITASVVLIKGSRSAGMERLVKVMSDDAGVNQ